MQVSRDDLKRKRNIFSLSFITHVVIDEAAQADEPSCLIPASRMNLLPSLILVGDDKQLGPVVVSKVAKMFGLGKIT